MIKGLRPFLREASTLKMDHHYPQTQDDEGQGDHGHHAPSQVHRQPIEQFHGGNSLPRGIGLDHDLRQVSERFQSLPIRYESSCAMTGAVGWAAAALARITL